MQDRPEIQFHDEISLAWETLHQSRVFRSRTKAMFDLLGQAVMDGQTWLDAGCGTGTLSRLLAERGCQVTGVDASSRMISVAKTQRPITSCDFLEIATIANLPFAGQSFDGVLCASVLEYVPDVDQCLAEIHRVLRPNGLLLVSIPNQRSLLRQAFRLCFAVSSQLSSRPLFRYLQFSTFEASTSGAKSLFAQHGLEILAYNFAGSPLPATFDRMPALGTLINILARRIDG